MASYVANLKQRHSADNAYSIPNPKRTVQSIKDKKWINSLFEKKVFTTPESKEFESKVKDALYEMIQFPTGRKRLQKVAKHKSANIGIRIATRSTAKAFPNPDGTANSSIISIAKRPELVHYYYNKEMTKTHPMDMCYILFHELGHIAHNLEDPATSRYRRKISLPIFTNLEEAYTIAGFAVEFFGQTYTTEIHDNAFLEERGWPQRYGHQAIIIKTLSLAQLELSYKAKATRQALKATFRTSTKAYHALSSRGLLRSSLSEDKDLKASLQLLFRYAINLSSTT